MSDLKGFSKEEAKNLEPDSGDEYIPITEIKAGKKKNWFHPEKLAMFGITFAVLCIMFSLPVAFEALSHSPAIYAYVIFYLIGNVASTLAVLTFAYYSNKK